jgi:hypothetical protein
MHLGSASPNLGTASPNPGSASAHLRSPSPTLGTIATYLGTAAGNSITAAIDPGSDHRALHVSPPFADGLRGFSAVASAILGPLIRIQ